LELGFHDRLMAQGGANCGAALANQVIQNATYTNQNLCNKQNDFNGDGIPVFNYAFNGKDWVYGFTASQSGYQRITISNFSAPKAIRPFLGVFQGCPSNANLIQFRAPNMPYWTPSAGAPLQIIIPVYQGVNYTIVVDGHLPPPPNDDYYSDCYSFTLQMQLSPFTVQSGCQNIGFEDGNLNNWFATTGSALESFPGFTTPFYNISNIGVNPDRHEIMDGGIDFFGGFPRVAPGMGNRSLRLGNQLTGAQAEGISRTFMVTPSNSSFTYWYAVVFQDPNHEPWEQPFFKAMLRTPNGDVINCTEFVVSAAANLPGFFNSPVNSNVRYKPWSSVNIDLSNYIGQVVTIEFTTGDCSHGAHFGYAYIDCFCSTSPFIQSDNSICPGENITLSIPNGYTQYLWNPGNHQTQSITVSPSVTTIYTAQVTSENGCVTEFQDTVFVAPAPLAQFNATPAGCNAPVQLSSQSTIAQGSITQTQWVVTSGVQNGNQINYQFPSSGTFPVTLMVTSDQGCMSSITQDISVPSCSLQAQMSNLNVCAGECATLQVQILDGQAPFSYQWQGFPGNSAPTLQVCPTSNTMYTVIVTDASGASQTLNAQVSIKPNPILNLSIQHPSCHNLSDGQASVQASGGSGFIYEWSTGQTQTSINNLSAGNYSITVRNADNCETTEPFTLNNPAPLQVLHTYTPANCGLANGTISLSATGGVSPFQFAINNGAFNNESDFMALDAGSYIVSVRDANNCAHSSSITLTENPYLQQFNITSTPPDCDGHNGNIHLNGTGFSGPFSLYLNGNLFANNISLPHSLNALNSGNYTLTLTDQNQCESTGNATLQAPDPIQNVTLQSTPATCGNQNACIEVQQVTGGAAPYEFALSGGVFQSSSQFCGLANGNYTLQIRDANQCIFESTVNVAAADGIQAEITTTQAISCYNANDGIAEVNIISGQGPFSYNWSNGSSNAQATALQAGNHQVTITDGNGCTLSLNLQVSEPAPITFSITETNTTCGLANGSIEVIDVAGASGNITLLLNGANAQLSNTNLSAGSYQVQLVDGSNCQNTQTVTIQETPYISQITTSLQQPDCTPNSGSINILSANISLSQATISLNGITQPAFPGFPHVLGSLNAGNYVLTISDENNCQLSESFILNLPSGPQNADINITPATCGNQNACIEVQQVTGGAAPYEFALSGGAFQSSSQFCGLANGNYTLQIRDANQCIFESTANVAAADGIQAEIITTQAISCHNANDGIAEVNIISGQGPFNYNWSNGSSDAQATALQAGNHQVTITDGNGCANTLQIALTQPEAIHFQTHLTNATCGSDNGSIDITDVNGANGSVIVWINGAQAEITNTGLPAGNFMVEIIDDNQCSTAQNIEIIALPYLSNLASTIQNPDCGIQAGSILLTNANHTLQNASMHLNGNLLSDFISFPYLIDNLSAGTYQLSISDENNCFFSESFTLNLPLGPQNADINITPATCGNQNACIEVQQVTGGAAPYEFALSGGAFQSSSQFCGLANGNYTLQIRDANQCIFESTVNVAAADGIQAEIITTQAISCHNANDGIAEVNIISGQGPFSYNWSNGSSNAQATALQAGNHQVTITDGNGCNESLNISFQNPSAIQATASSIAETCSSNNGQITLSDIQGGSGNNYTYYINQNVYPTEHFENLSPGTYSITVMDDNQCTWDTVIVIPSIAHASLISTLTEAPSCAENNGLIQIVSIEGLLPGTALYLNNQQIGTASYPLEIANLSDGNYTLLLTDTNSCNLEHQVQLNRLAAPSGIQFIIEAATCNQANASLEILSVLNGNGPFTYAINSSDFSNALTFHQLAPGNITLRVKDVNGCITDTLVNIPAAPPVSAALDNIANVACHGDASGSAEIFVSAGQAPYSAVWSDGYTGFIRNDLAAGNYQIQISDAHQCEATLNLAITQPDLLVSIPSFVHATCGNENGSINLLTSGGFGPYTYFLNGVSSANSEFINLPVGDYQLSVQDANQCESPAMMLSIQMMSYPQLIETLVTDESCSQSNGSIIIQHIEGGTGSIRISFAGQEISYSNSPILLDQLPAGLHLIQVSDSNNCVLNETVEIINLSGPESAETDILPTTCNLDNGCIEIGEVNGGNGLVNYSLDAINFAPYPSFCNLASGDYVLTLKDQLGCELSIPLFVPATIPVNANAEKLADITCYGANDGQGMAMANVGTGPFQYLWSNGEQAAHAQQLPAGDHTAFITDIYGCIDSSMIHIDEPQPLSIQAFADQVSCAGDVVMLHATAFGGIGNITIQWQHDGSNQGSVAVNPIQTTEFVVSATDENSCTMWTSVTQFVNPLPNVEIVSDLEKACAPACINFGLQQANQQIVQYQWLIADSLSSANPDPKFCFEQPGVIHAQVWVEDLNGCKNSGQVFGITQIHPTPEVDFSFNPSAPDILRPEVDFTQSSTHTVFWRWNFGDGNTAFMPDPVHSYQDTGRFEVCLEVISVHGCMNDICKDVYIKPVFTFYMPNAFTPDGDGLNDIFKPEGTFVKDIQWMIFNRWGEMIFESKDLNKGWDGFFKGREAQNDVYTWVATVRTFDNQIIRKEGMVKLLR
jgi:gliding motility-associated-like protein